MKRRKLLAHTIAWISLVIFNVVLFIIITSPITLVFLIDDEFRLSEFFKGILTVTLYSIIFTTSILLPLVIAIDLIKIKYKRLSVFLAPIIFFITVLIYLTYLLLNLEIDSDIGNIVDVIFKPIILLPISGFLLNIYWVIFNCMEFLVKLRSKSN